VSTEKRVLSLADLAAAERRRRQLAELQEEDRQDRLRAAERAARLTLPKPEPRREWLQ
jgi:hypothetical protein